MSQIEVRPYPLSGLVSALFVNFGVRFARLRDWNVFWSCAPGGRIGPGNRIDQSNFLIAVIVSRPKSV